MSGGSPGCLCPSHRLRMARVGAATLDHRWKSHDESSKVPTSSVAPPPSISNHAERNDNFFCVCLKVLKSVCHSSLGYTLSSIILVIPIAPVFHFFLCFLWTFYCFLCCIPMRNYRGLLPPLTILSPSFHCCFHQLLSCPPLVFTHWFIQWSLSLISPRNALGGSGYSSSEILVLKWWNPLAWSKGDTVWVPRRSRDGLQSSLHHYWGQVQRDWQS